MKVFLEHARRVFDIQNVLEKDLQYTVCTIGTAPNKHKIVVITK